MTKVNPEATSLRRSKRKPRPTHKAQIFKAFRASRATRKKTQTTQHASPLKSIGNTWQLDKDDNNKLNDTIGVPPSTKKYQQKKPSKYKALKIAPSPATNLINNLRDQYKSNKQPQQLFK